MRLLVVAELDGARVRSATLSAITFARHVLATDGAGAFDILVLGAAPHTPAAELTGFGAERVLVGADATLADYLAERFAPSVAAVATAGYDLVVATATAYGKDLLPRVAGRLDAGYVSDCLGVTREGGRLVYERPLYAGNARGHCVIETPVAVVSVRQSEHAPARPTPGSVSPLETVPVAAPGGAASRIEHVAFDRVTSARPELTEARVVVAGGRGLKDQFFEVLEPLAAQLGAAIGATRAACDAGYAPGDYQVGQTGKVVAPELYVAVGISGALQHVAGMRGSRVVVAIDHDPEAPIFAVADYGLVGDLFDLVPELTRALASRTA